MSRILALDTSTWWGGIALLERSRPGESAAVVAEVGADVHGSHGERLIGRIEWLLAEAGWAKTSLDAYAAARGPGSFTGVRVGLGTIRGLGLASERPCYGVGTLEALAEAHGPDVADRVPLIGAGRGELYGARFDARSSPPGELESPWLAGIDQMMEQRSEAGEVWIPAPGTTIDPPPPDRVRVARAPRGTAAAVGRIVAHRQLQLDGPAPPLVPVYVRPADVRVRRRSG